MSKETMRHLNTNTLIGFTEKRGKAWHYRADLQGDQSNHYPGAIPVGDVSSRLFNWTADSRRVAVEFPATLDTMTHFSATGEPLKWLVQADQQAITRGEQRLGTFKPGYKIHDFNEWLIKNVEKIIGEGLAVSSAGLLKLGAVAWVEISMPETITTPLGIAFRPNLLAATSLDGSIATTYKRTVQLTVCDNTMNVALGERGQTIKVRHSSQSLEKISDVRAALAMVHETADQAVLALDTAVDTEVSELQFLEIISQMVPLADDAGKRATTTATQKREQLKALWTSDPRVAPWQGTAFGVLQTFNTFHHHVQGGLAKGDDEAQRHARADRNAWRAISGETDSQDAKVAATLVRVLTNA